MTEKPKLYLIAGPTAAGKSAAALALAKQVNGTVINADAMQIYADLPILTAQPNKIDRIMAPHALYGVLNAAKTGSAARWVALAQQEISLATEKGLSPILVGGTGLYFKALLNGLSKIPNISANLKAEFKLELEKHGLEFIRSRLSDLDPASYARLKPLDSQRILRAYEVVRATGKPLGWWHDQEQGSGIRDQYDLKLTLLMPDRAELYARCDQRFLNMIEQGAIAEVEQLLIQQLDPNLPAMKTIGVRELGAYLRQEISLDEAIAKAQQATRNYAKRQMTWFRNQDLTGSG